MAVAGPVLVTARSAEVATERKNVAEGKPAVGSLVVLVAVALSVRVEPSATLGLIRATMVTVRVAPAAKAPTASVKEVPLPVPSLAETNVSPEGSVSDRLTPWASEGPALVSVRV